MTGKTVSRRGRRRPEGNAGDVHLPALSVREARAGRAGENRPRLRRAAASASSRSARTTSRRIPKTARRNSRIRRRSCSSTFPICSTSRRMSRARTTRSARPTFFSMTRQGRLVYRGQLDDSRPGNDVPVTGRDLRAALDALIAGRAILQRSSARASAATSNGDERPSVGASERRDQTRPAAAWSERRVARVEEPSLRLLRRRRHGAGARRAGDRSRRIASGAGEQRATPEMLDYDPIYAGSSPWRLLVPIDHPEPARCLVSGTGLTHLGSAENRAAMHGKSESRPDRQHADVSPGPRRRPAGSEPLRCRA